MREEARAKFRAALQHVTRPNPNAGDPLAWARRIVDRHQRGDSVAQGTLQIACEALRIPIPEKPSKEKRT